MPATNRKPTANNVSTGRQKMLAAIQILYKKSNPYLEDADELRAARLEFVTKLLNLPVQCQSISDLTDKQLGLVLDELRKMTGSGKPVEPAIQNRFSSTPPASGLTNQSVVHLASEAQVFTINKLVGFMGWNDYRFREFLFKKTRRRSPRLLTFEKANGFTMIMLTVAAHKDLKELFGRDTSFSRAKIEQHIPELKRKLQIDQR